MSCVWFICFFFKQKTAYEMRISDWSSDVCSSDLLDLGVGRVVVARIAEARAAGRADAARRALEGGGMVHRRDQRLVLRVDEAERLGGQEIGRASGRERVCRDVLLSVVAGS